MTIGNSVTSIGIEAFYYCNGLTSVTIGNSVTEIGYGAFMSCENLQSIYCLGETPAKLDRYCFLFDEHAVLYVPFGCIDAYRNDTDGWGQFNDIREFDPTKVEGTLDLRNSTIEKVFDLSGRSQQRMQRGINIVRYGNGTVKKVLVK